MSGDDNKRAVAEFVERCQNQHDLAFADEAFHPKFVNHYRPEGRALPETDRPASGFQVFYGALLQGFPMPPWRSTSSSPSATLLRPARRSGSTPG